MQIGILKCKSTVSTQSRLVRADICLLIRIDSAAHGQLDKSVIFRDESTLYDVV